jgi:transposase InsO family protein
VSSRRPLAAANSSAESTPASCRSANSLICAASVGVADGAASPAGDGEVPAPSRLARTAAITAWIHRYNTVRLHSSIGYVPPIEWELKYRHTGQLAA